MEPCSTSGKLIRQTSSLCSHCKQSIGASIVERDGAVFMEKHCARHGDQSVMIASDAAWYHDIMSYPAVLKPPFAKKPVELGCPFDCGACSAHEQSVYLPVIAITSACNLDCPICYTINKNDNPFHMPLEEFAQILEVIGANDPQMRIINITGGEPTLHPQLTDIIRLCHEAGIHRITISTHGLTLIKNEKLLRQLADLNTRMILSFDSFDDGVNERMIGSGVYKAKMRVLDQFEAFGIDTTLIPVIAKGVNDHELGRLIDLLLTRKSLRSLEIHTMTFTGQGGQGFEPSSRITASEVLQSIEQASGGRIAMGDFVPSPCAHPMCYQTCYLLEAENRDHIPFTRFMSKKSIRELLTDNLYMEPGEKMERVFSDTINALWADGDGVEHAELILKTLKRNIKALFPAQAIDYQRRQQMSEQYAKTIYVHAHMDEHNFDNDRIRQCCVGVPSPDRGNIPTCAYNILYRGRLSRFSDQVLVPLSQLASRNT